MKNIAIPLLMASSARADKRKDELMAADRAVPKPILIADEWHDNDCVDAAGDVAAKYSALVSAEEKLAEATGLRAGLVEAVEAAAEAKTAAITAVVEHDAGMETALEADDAAQMLERTKKSALDQATIDEAVAIAAAELALELKTAADTALEEAQEIKEAMDTAYTAAEEHATHELGQTESWEGKVASAEADYNTKEGAIEGLESLYAGENSTYTPLQATTDTKKALWDDYLSLATKLGNAYTTSEAPLDASTAGTAAEELTAEETRLTNTELADLNTKAGEWQTVSKLAVTSLWQWINEKEAYTAVESGKTCDGSNAYIHVGGNGGSDDSICTTFCSTLQAWGGTNAVPTASATDGTGTPPTYCYGIDWNSGGTCQIYPSAKVTTATSAVSGTQCKSRNKSTVGETTGAAIAAATNQVSEYTEMTTKLGLWATQSSVVDDKQRYYNLANEYKGKMQTEKDNAESSRDTYEGEYNEAYEASEAAKETRDSAETDVDTKISDTATALTLLNSYKASLSTQEAEEEAQDALVALALSDKETQAETVTSLEGLAEEADTANEDAIAEEQAKTEAKETAEEEYSAAFSSAEETESTLATPLEELAGLRSTAVERTQELVEALSNESSQEGAIAGEQDLVDEASEAHIAALVACRSARFDQYAEALAGAESARASKLADIDALIDANPLPAAGTIGARCEKAVSNGTMRPKRNVETCTGETVCCGASKVAVGNLILTIETCQNDTTTSYTYVPPRAPMETSMPAGTSHPFACIDGAQKLAAATSALAAAVYMLA